MDLQATGEAGHVWDALANISKALVEKNAGVLEQLLSEDFIGAIPTGASFTKTAYIEHHCKPGFGIVGLSNDADTAVAIRLYGDTAVVNHRMHAQFALPAGNTIEYDVQRIEVFVKEKNNWLMISGQGTQVKPPGV